MALLCRTNPSYGCRHAFDIWSLCPQKHHTNYDLIKRESSPSSSTALVDPRCLHRANRGSNQENCTCRSSHLITVLFSWNTDSLA
jgi:hypothetical protein